MIEGYKSNYLSIPQKIQRELIAPAEGSCSKWMFRRIEHYTKYENIQYNRTVARILKRVIAVAMPIFSFADTFYFAGKSLFKICTLHPQDALYELLKCGRSFTLFLLSVPLIPFALIIPDLTYRTENEWMTSQKTNLQSRIKESLDTKVDENVSKKDHFKSVLVNVTKELVETPESRKNLIALIDVIIDQIPWSGENKELISETYLHFVTEFYVEMVNTDFPISSQPEPFKELGREIFSIRSPKIREKLMMNLLHVGKEQLEIYDKYTERQNSLKLKGARKVALFLLLQISDEETGIQLINESYFKNKTTNLQIIDFLLNCIETEYKAEVFKRFLDCYELDVKLQSKDKEVMTVRRNINRLKRKVKKQPKLQDEIDRLQKQIPENYSSPKNKFSNMEGAIRILTTLFSLQDDNLINICLEALDDDSSSFQYINDPKIIAYLFKKIFEVKEISDDLDEALSKIRKPSALIHYHSRLMELEKQDKEKALSVFQDFLKAALSGTLTGFRHKVENNPHLKKIFEYSPELQAKWIEHKEMKIKDVDFALDSKFENWSVMEVEDCSDLILQASEFYNSCVSLNGRLPKVHGLLGIMVDGKTHTILVKDASGNPRAKARIVLLWDEKNEKPVLYVDAFDVQTGMDDLVKVMKQFVKIKADEMELDMVTTFGEGGSRHSGFGPKYKGNAVSLGSNSPVEYVNTLMRTCERTYEINPVYVFNPE